MGEDTARRDSASVRRATRGPIAQQVGRGMNTLGLVPVGWGGRAEGKEQNNSQFGCTCLLSVAAVFESITIGEVTS